MKYLRFSILFILSLIIVFFTFSYVLKRGRTPYKIKIKVSEHTLSGVKFKKVNLGTETAGQHTSLAIGPNKMLYASTLDGKIKRFRIANDGTLKLEATYKPFGTENKLLIGLLIDPQSNANQLIAWITYSDFPELQNGPNWDGRIAKLVLNSKNDDVITNTLIVTNLPRSGSDHLTNSLTFGPDGAIYISQGSNTQMGKSNNNKTYLKREESLLSAAILRLDIHKLPKKLPLNVKTEEGYAYKPFAKNAPLTIFATGFRNAYDLVWHSNQELYVPVNGSKNGGSTPTSNPQDSRYIKPYPGIKNQNTQNIPVVDSIKDQTDWLFRVEKNGYYGHPNPIRAEYAAMRGSLDIDKPAYKNIKPEANFRGGDGFNFGKHASPNGIIEYKGTMFGGNLKGKLMVVRFNNYNDVAILEVDSQTKNITKIYDGFKVGIGNLNQPLDLAEDPNTGNIYVSEFGGDGAIVLFKPDFSKTSQNPVTTTKPKMSASDESKLLASTNSLDLEKGKTIFMKNCAICHGKSEEGFVAPNLIDKYWLYGGSFQDMYKVIKNGTDKGMQAWGNHLESNDIQKVASFILSIQGTNPPNQKEAEGKLYEIPKQPNL